jgi:hypothetical protein
MFTRKRLPLRLRSSRVVVNDIRGMNWMSRADLPERFIPELGDLIVATLGGRDLS